MALGRSELSYSHRDNMTDERFVEPIIPRDRLHTLSVVSPTDWFSPAGGNWSGDSWGMIWTGLPKNFYVLRVFWNLAIPQPDSDSYYGSIAMEIEFDWYAYGESMGHLIARSSNIQVRKDVPASGGKKYFGFVLPVCKNLGPQNDSFGIIGSALGQYLDVIYPGGVGAAANAGLVGYVP